MNSIQLPKENGISFLRYFLASSLIMFHYYVATDHAVPIWLGNGWRIKAFFILTGLLTYYSYSKRPDAKALFIRRFKGLVPMYALTILLCFIVGCLLTTMSFIDFITHPQSLKYLLANITFLNFIQPTLPGVFESHPLSAMDASLWTMKINVMFYFTVPLVYKLLQRYPKQYVMLTLLLLSIAYNETFIYLYNTTNNDIFAFLRRQIGGQYIFFLAGMALYFWYPQIKSKIWYLAIPCLLLFVLSNFVWYNIYLTAVTYAIVIITICLHIPIFRRCNRLPNYTYGMYLFHFPIIQILVHFNIPQNHFVGGLMLTYVLTLSMAAIAHYFIDGKTPSVPLKETPSFPLNRRMRESRSELAHIMPNEEEEDEVSGG